MKKLATISIPATLLSAISSGLFAQSAPVSDTLQVNSIRARVQSNFLYDATGRLVKTVKVEGDSAASIPTRALPVGLYILRVRNRDGRESSFKLIHE